MTRPMLDPEFVANYKRLKMMDAALKLVAERGYEGTNIAHIVKRAGVARKTLYDNFEGKEQVFRAAVDQAIEDAHAVVENAIREAEGISARAEAAIDALLQHADEEPEVLKVCLVDLPMAWLERHESMHHEFAALTGLPETQALLLVGSISHLLYKSVLGGEPDGGLRDALLDCTRLVFPIDPPDPSVGQEMAAAAS